MADPDETLDHRLSVRWEAVSLRANAGACERLVHAIADGPNTLARLKLLHILARPHDQPPRISRVGSMLRVTPPQATRIVSALERDRLVDRIEDERDARVKRVVITPKGRQVVDELERVRVAGAERFFRLLPVAEARALDDALAPLTRRADVAVYMPLDDPK